MSGKVLPARRELFALHSPGWRLKGSRSSGWSRTRAVYCHPAGRSSRSRVNIVVLELPYKHKQQDGLCAAAVCSRGKCEIGPKDRKSGLPVLLSEVEASLDFFSDKEISSLLQTSNAQRPTLNVQIDLPAEGLEPTRPCGHWILSPARLPIPPRRRGQEHTHFARRDEHFDWPRNTGCKPLLHWHPELLPLLLKRKESRHVTAIGKAFWDVG